MAGNVYTYLGNADRSQGTASLSLSQGTIALGQSGLVLPSEYLSLVGDGVILKPGPAASPASALTLPVVASTGSGPLTGQYQYAYTFITAAGETTSGPESALTMLGQNGSLSSIPVGSATSGVIARGVYRTVAGGALGTEHLATVINDNTTTTLVDGVADGGLGRPIPTVDTSAVVGGTGPGPPRSVPYDLAGAAAQEQARAEAAEASIASGEMTIGTTVPGAVASSLLVTDASKKLASGPTSSSVANVAQANTFSGGPQIFLSQIAVTNTAGGLPKITSPAGSPMVQVDAYGNYRFGRNLTVTDFNPGTTHQLVADGIVFANNPGRPFFQSLSLTTFNDPPDLTFGRFGNPSGYGGGSGVVIPATASNTVTLIDSDVTQLQGFVVGQTIYGDNVLSVVPANTTITSLNGGVVASTSGGNSTITLTLSAAIVASQGSTLFSAARPADYFGNAAGSILGQVKGVPAFAPYGGTNTTPGAQMISQSASQNFRTTEIPRNLVSDGRQLLALGTEIRFFTARKGRGSSDNCVVFSDDGCLLVGIGAIGSGSTGDLHQIRGHTGTNAAHTITASRASIGTLSAPLNPGGGAITSLPIGGGGVANALPNGASVTTTVTLSNMTVATQTWVLNAPALAGDPSLTVVSEIPNYAYPAGQAVIGNTIVSGTFTLSFYPDPPANGYATPAVSAAIGELSGGYWQATSGDVATALAGITAGSSVMQCSFGTAALALKLLAPNGQIPSLGATVTGTAIGRADAGCITTNLSTTVTDASITAPDAGRALAGTGIPAGATIVSVTPGVSFVMSAAAIASGTATIFIGIPATVVAGRSDAGCVTNSTTLVTDASVIAADVNKTVTGSNIPLGTTIVSVAPGVSFVMSAPASTSATVTLRIGDPTVAGFTISAATSNNSNGASITISGFTLGLDSGAVTITGGPLPGTAITATFIGPYYGFHNWKPMFAANSLVGGTVSCSDAVIGLPSDAGQRMRYGRAAVTKTADYDLLVDENGATVFQINSAKVLNVPAGMMSATQAPGDNSTNVATTAFVQATVQAAVQGLSIKPTAHAAANAETLTIAGGSVTTITGTTVDGVSVAVNDRVLIPNAPAATGAAAGSGYANFTAQPSNGLYIVTAVGANISVAREPEMSGSNGPAGAFVFVAAGSAAQSGFAVLAPTTNTGFAYGTNNIQWTQFSGAGAITVSAPLVKVGPNLSVTFGTTAATITQGNDSRLSDSRTPTGTAGGSLTGTYPNPSVAALAITDSMVAAANKDGASGTASMRTLGTGASQACAGNDSRLGLGVVGATITSSSTWTPSVTGTYALLLVGGGSGGGGGGASQVTTPVAQAGGAGGGAGAWVIQFVACTSGVGIPIVIGAGSNGGAACAAGSGASGTAGNGSSTGNSTTSTLPGPIVITAVGGSAARGGLASSATAVSGSGPGDSGSNSTLFQGPGWGGISGVKGGSPYGYSGGGGGGGGAATTGGSPLGGTGGGAGTTLIGGAAGTSGGSGTTAGTAGSDAPANSGGGGGGGGGGAAGGGGGKGGNGGSGFFVGYRIY